MIVLDHKPNPVTQLAFSSTGRYLAVSQNWCEIHLWDLTAQISVGEIRRAQSYTRAEFRFHPTQPGICHPDNLGDRGEVYWTDLVGKDGEILAKHMGVIENLLISHDATRLLVHERSYSQFHLFDLTNGQAKKPVWSVPVYSTNAHGIRVAMELLPDGERFIVTENHGNTRTRVSVRSIETGDLLDVARFPQRETLGLAVSPDGTVAVVISEMSLFVYDPEHLKTAPRKVKNDNRKHFKGIAFHPSGKYIAATSNDQTVKFYDTTTWTVPKTYTWNIGRMLRVAFSPDGTLAAAGSDTGKVVVWDVDL